MKIAFFGSDPIALPGLRAIQHSSEGWEICGVLTQPDRKSGRGRKLRSNPIKEWALEEGIPVQNPEKPDGEQVDWLKAIGADLTLVMAYGHILKNDLLHAAPFGCFNLHASLLPKYRGASPIETALAMGESKTGVTLMRVIPRMDAGPIIDHEIISISSSDTGSSLRDKVSQACVPLIQRAMPDLLGGKFSEIAQEETEASYCRKLNKTDGQIDFSLSAQAIEYRFRAFAGWPGCYFIHKNVPLKVGELRICHEISNLTCGQHYDENPHVLIIGTGTQAIEILELQKPGGKMLPIGDFLRGYDFATQIIFPSPKDQKKLVHL